MDGQRPDMVYPRVCGGTLAVSSAAVLLGGLSPRVRGNLDATVQARMSAGSIPACAWEPLGEGVVYRFEAVYPRVCGGTLKALASDLNVAGLSPRVRGNPTRMRRWDACWGSIPACAGEP